MATSTIVGSLHVTDTITAGGGVQVGSNSVTDSSVAAGAGIAASKLEHQYVITEKQVGSAADETRIMHIAQGDGDIVGVKAACIGVAVGSATCTVDVKKNGTTILTGVITLNSSSVTLVAQSGTLATTTYGDGDVFTVVFDGTTSGGTLPTGVAATLILREDAAP